MAVKTDGTERGNLVTFVFRVSAFHVLSPLLLSSKETLARCSQIATAFRVCKEAFVKLSAAYINLLECNTPSLGTIGDIVRGTLVEACDGIHACAASSCSIARESAGGLRANIC